MTFIKCHLPLHLQSTVQFCHLLVHIKIQSWLIMYVYPNLYAFVQYICFQNCESTSRFISTLLWRKPNASDVPTEQESWRFSSIFKTSTCTRWTLHVEVNNTLAICASQQFVRDMKKRTGCWKTLDLSWSGGSDT